VVSRRIRTLGKTSRKRTRRRACEGVSGVFVTPEKVSDIEAKEMARDIVRKIEQELKYPGEIKITMIRETRIVEYAR
jgi:HD superfamily phosphodiesterase